MRVPISRLLYFRNDVSLECAAPEECVRLTQLREGARSTRLVTTCCHCALSVDHPAYAAGVVMVPTTANVLNGAEHVPPPAKRIYMDDWDEAHDGPCPPPMTNTDPTLWHGQPVGDLRGVFKNAFAEPAPARQGVSLQELFASLGPAKVLGLEEKARFEPKPARAEGGAS